MKSVYKVCKICSWETSDITNKSGSITKHMKTHKLLFEEIQNNISEVEKEEQEKLSCPICCWTCSDLNNESGVFTVHLKTIHQLDIGDFTEKYPTYKHLWKLYFERIYPLKQPENCITCLECGKVMRKLVRTHLAIHGLTPTQYKQKYNVDTTTSKGTSIKQRKYKIEEMLNSIFSGNRLPDLEPQFSKEDYIGVGETHVNKYSFKCKKCNHIFISDLDDGNIPVCPKCYPLANTELQKEIYNFITSLGVVVSVNDRGIIPPKEIDLYIPDKK